MGLLVWVWVWLLLEGRLGRGPRGWLAGAEQAEPFAVLQSKEQASGAGPHMPPGV